MRLYEMLFVLEIFSFDISTIFHLAFLLRMLPYQQLCVTTMTAFMFPSIWSQFKFNLLLQIFDGLFTYHVLSQGIPEANPLVSSAIAEWGAIWGIVFWKVLACALLTTIFAVRHFREALAMKALTLTSTVYGSLFLVSLYYLLQEFCG